MRILLLLLILAVNVSAGMTPAQLRCEYRENPLGIDVAAPRLSWILQSDARDQRQTAYQIVVTTADNKTLWDTGNVASGETIQIPYAGKPLE